MTADWREHASARRARPPQVRGALGQISEKYRSVLVLKYMEGLSYERIAEMLEIRVATVDKRLTRAKTMLRKLLKDV